MIAPTDAKDCANQSPPVGKGDLSLWLAWQECAHPSAWDLGLTRIGAVWQALGAPRIAKRVLTIAGTNGKGSCVAIAEALANAHGLRVGSFTSPHLLRYNERIRFAGKAVSDADLCRAFDAIEAARDGVSLTYFEWSALAAFWLMAEYAPDVAVLEVGLGGRLDAVNLIDADAVIFTRIGLDHQDWLGDSVEAIALEKAGVLRKGQTVAFADAAPPLALRQKALELGDAVWFLGEALTFKPMVYALSMQTPNFVGEMPYPPALLGAHQFGHLTAVMAVMAAWFEMLPEKLVEASENITHFGRLTSVVRGKQRWLFDVAHNADSAEVLAAHLKDVYQNQRIIAFCSILADKDMQSIFSQLAPFVAKWYVFALDAPRAASLLELEQAALAAGILPSALCLCQNFEMAQNMAQADELAAKAPVELRLVTGSFLTVAAVWQQEG